MFKSPKENLSFNTYVTSPEKLNIAYLTLSNLVKQNSKVFVIAGDAGSGKTHLLNATAQKLALEFPNLKVAFTDASRFIQNMVKSLQYGDIDDFRGQFRDIDILLIDNAEIFYGKNRSLDELFDLRELILANDGKLVLAFHYKENDDISLIKRSDDNLSRIFLSATIMRLNVQYSREYQNFLKKELHGYIEDENMLNMIELSSHGSVSKLKNMIDSIKLCSQELKVSWDTDLLKKFLVEQM